MANVTIFTEYSGCYRPGANGAFGDLSRMSDYEPRVRSQLTGFATGTVRYGTNHIRGARTQFESLIKFEC